MAMFPRLFLERCHLFGNVSVMVRKPAIECFKAIQRHHWDKAKLNLVLYGKTGDQRKPPIKMTKIWVQICSEFSLASVSILLVFSLPGNGKSITLGHVNHYFQRSENVITVYTGTMKRWLQWHKEAKKTRTKNDKKAEN